MILCHDPPPLLAVVYAMLGDIVEHLRKNLGVKQFNLLASKGRMPFQQGDDLKLALLYRRRRTFASNLDYIRPRIWSADSIDRRANEIIKPALLQIRFHRGVGGTKGPDTRRFSSRCEF